jgi:OOP family OmpA-OmpF porin
MRNHLRIGAVATLVVVVASGCTVQQRRWGTCAVAGAVIGGTIGGVTGGVATNNQDGEPTNEERGGAIGGGVVGGALIGGLLGHLICDPVKEPPPPPPPPAPAPPAPGTKLGTIGETFFDFDRAELKGDPAVLAEVLRVMRDNPTLRVTVEGHTDSVGSDAYNQGLSERRADAVRNYLVRQGIDASRIETVGHGESKPVATNATAAGRSQNRRAEIIAR